MFIDDDDVHLCTSKSELNNAACGAPSEFGFEAFETFAFEAGVETISRISDIRFSDVWVFPRNKFPEIKVP